MLEVLAAEELDTFAARQKNLRDRFALVALRELGLRSSELVGAKMNAFHSLLDPKDGRSYWIFTVSAATGKGAKQRHIPVTEPLISALMEYRRAFGLAPRPGEFERTGLLLSPRTRPVTIGCHHITSTTDRRYFGAWKELRSRHSLYQIIKQRMGETATILRLSGRDQDADCVDSVTPHWLRHTFAHSILRRGHGLREVASLLGHATTGTTMIYTEQAALDLIRAIEHNQPGAVARSPGELSLRPALGEK